MEITTEEKNSNSTTQQLQQHYTYILKLNDGSYYTGITNNIVKRTAQHDMGQSKSTKRHLPVKLIYKMPHTTRSEARRLEVKIKNMGAARYLNKVRFTSKYK